MTVVWSYYEFGNRNINLIDKQKQPPEVSIKKVSSKISQYSQENNCVGVSF